MTVERASEIVMAVKGHGTKEYELFTHFVDFFGFKKPEKVEWFAQLCGYGIARFVEVIDEE